MLKKKSPLIALAGLLNWLEHYPYTKVTGFDPQSRHIEESTNECINKWNKKSVFLSLFLHPHAKKSHFINIIRDTIVALIT